MERDFETVPVGRLVWQLGLPAMLAQLFNILYSIVDRVYIGRMAAGAETALASIGICSPAFTAVTGFASLVGVGGASLMSISLGERNRERAQQAMNNALLLLLLFSAVVTGGLLALKRPFLYLLGCSDAMYPAANTYFTIYALGTPAVLCGVGLNRFIMGQGCARQGMLSVVLGALVNLVLDPVFIYGLNLGVAGAALATVLSQLCVLVYVLAVLNRRSMSIRLGFGQYSAAVCRRILSIGSMPFLIIVLDNLLIVLLNAMLRSYGGAQGDRYISYAAVVQSVMVVAICPAEGLTSGCATLFSYYYGAGSCKRILESFRYVLLYAGLYLGVLTLAITAFPELFVRLFLSDPAAVAQAAVFTRRYCMGFFFVAVQFAFVDGFTAMGMVREAVPISFFRKGLYVLAVLMLPRLLPLEDIFYACPLSDCLGALFTIVVYALFLRKRLLRTCRVRTADQG